MIDRFLNHLWHFLSSLQTSVIIDEREFPGLGAEVKRSPPPSSRPSKSATAESSKGPFSYDVRKT